MATAPENVYRNRIAVIEEYGFDATQVTANGFTSHYFEVVGDHTNRDTNRRLILEDNSALITRIYWPDEKTRERARQAIENDYRETVGDDAYDAVQKLKAQERWSHI